MHSNNSESDEVEDRSRGWNLRAAKGKQRDRTSPGFKLWQRKQKESKRRSLREKYEKLAKAPLLGRVYKGDKSKLAKEKERYDRRKKRN